MICEAKRCKLREIKNILKVNSLAEDVIFFYKFADVNDAGIASDGT